MLTALNSVLLTAEEAQSTEASVVAAVGTIWSCSCQVGDRFEAKAILIGYGPSSLISLGLSGQEAVVTRLEDWCLKMRAPRGDVYQVGLLTRP